MPWQPEYVMQNKRLTKEHYGLVYFTNVIQHLLDTNQEEASKEILMKELVPLAQRHLRFEILVMNTIEYKNINEERFNRHCQAHAKLEEGIADIAANIATIKMSDVVSFLKDWLDNHIRVEDAGYNAEIVKLGITNG